MIQVEALSKSYRGNQVLRQVSVHIRKAEIFGILGRNGAGKTTFLECLIGLRKKDSGTVKVLGEVVLRDSPVIKYRVGIQPQEAALLQRQTVKETLELFSSFYENSMDLQQLIEQLNLSNLLNKQARQLSKGQKQRLLLGVAMVGNPDILILDEPTSGLDPQVRRSLWDVIRGLKDQGRTILLTTHYMEEAEQLCDRVAILHDGTFVVQGSPAELVREYADPRERNLESAFMKITGTTIRGGID